MRWLLLIVVLGCSSGSHRVGPGTHDGKYCQFSLCDGHCCGDRACWTQYCTQLACKTPLPAVSLVSPPANAAQVAAGAYRTCVVTDRGSVRCFGELAPCLAPYGYAAGGPVEQFQPVFPAPRVYPNDIPLGSPTAAVSVDGNEICALGRDRTVRCWGDGPIIEVAKNASQVSVGGAHVCVLVDGAVQCWGWNSRGELGLADRERRMSPKAVFVGARVISVEAGSSHTCAILENHHLRCWGDGLDGRLGYGNERLIGDDEQPASAGDVPVGEPVEQVVLGGRHTCVLVARGRVKCWGDASIGQLGNGFVNPILDARKATEVPLGGPAIALAAGSAHTCALLASGAVRCWGEAANGQLGYATEHDHVFDRIGDDEDASEAKDVALGERAVQITAGANHTCARLASGALKCWGQAYHGELGYPPDKGKTLFDSDIGDDETPADRGNVPFASNWDAP